MGKMIESLKTTTGKVIAGTATTATFVGLAGIGAWAHTAVGGGVRLGGLSIDGSVGSMAAGTDAINQLTGKKPFHIGIGDAGVDIFIGTNVTRQPANILGFAHHVGGLRNIQLPPGFNSGSGPSLNINSERTNPASARLPKADVVFRVKNKGK